VEDFSQRSSAIELGAGCGLVGIVLAQLGVREVVLTDMGPTMDILKKNAKENACAGVSLTTQELEWGKPCAVLDGKKFDLIVATDTMYEPGVIPALILCLLSFSHEKTEIYIAYGRNSHAEADFCYHMKNLGYVAELVPSDLLDEVYQSLEIKVVKIHNRGMGEETISYEPEKEECKEEEEERAEQGEAEKEETEKEVQIKEKAKKRKRKGRKKRVANQAGNKRQKVSV